MKTNQIVQNRERNIWFNPHFSKNISNNSGKCFRLLIQKHFPSNDKYYKIFNKKNVEISYSCMANIKSIISIHNEEAVMEKKTQTIVNVIL